MSSYDLIWILIQIKTKENELKDKDDKMLINFSK